MLRYGLQPYDEPADVARLTDPTRLTESSCCIYINPTQPSLALVFFLRERQLLSGSLHLCQGKYLHIEVAHRPEHDPAIVPDARIKELPELLGVLSDF